MPQQTNLKDGLYPDPQDDRSEEVALNSREMEELAEKIVALLMEELMIENERFGRD